MNATPLSQPAIPPNDEEISLVEIANTVLRNWRVVVVVPVLLALVVGVWSLSRDRRFTASGSFMPQSAEGRTLSGAAALAQQFGVSLGSEGPGQSPQFYVDLLHSMTLLRQAVESEYQIPTEDGGTWTGTLVQYWELDGAGGSLPPWHRATEILSDDISASVARETGVVHLSVLSENPVLAERVAERLLELLNEFNLEVRQNRAEQEGRFIGGRKTEAQAELLAAEDALQDFLLQNRLFRNSPELVFTHDRLQRQVAMRQEVYTSLLRSEEQARIDAVRDTPLLTVIDHPAGTAEPQGRGTVKLAMLAFALGLMLAVFLAFVREAARRSRQTKDPHYREFEGLARELWADLRNPARWMRWREKTVTAGDSREE